MGCCCRCFCYERRKGQRRVRAKGRRENGPSRKYDVYDRRKAKTRRVPWLAAGIWVGRRAGER